MRLKLVRIEKGAFDAELLVAAVGLVLVLGVAALGVIPQKALPQSVCTFHRLTGRPCLTCGGTRAARALSRLDLSRAFRCNPLVAALLAAAGPYILWVLLARACRWPRPRLEAASRRDRWLIGLGIAALLAANWTYLVLAGI
jgi:hypothetical protein